MSNTLSDPDIVELAEALRPGILRVSRKLRQEAQKAGLSAQDALLLGRIKHKPGVGVSELADEEQISRPTMSAHVKRLEAEGLVARADHDADGRRVGLTITSVGMRKLEAIRRRRNDWLAAQLARLTADERLRLAAAAEALARLVDPEP